MGRKQKVLNFWAEPKSEVLTKELTNIPQSPREAVETAYEGTSSYCSKEQIANIILVICQINSWNRVAMTCGYVPGSYEG